MNANPAGPAEAETHLTDEEYRALWATSTDAVLIMDEHGTIRYANPAVLECLNLFLDVACFSASTEWEARRG